jgi:hypothetical protein
MHPLPPQAALAVHLPDKPEAVHGFLCRVTDHIEEQWGITLPAPAPAVFPASAAERGREASPAAAGADASAEAAPGDVAAAGDQAAAEPGDEPLDPSARPAGGDGRAAAQQCKPVEAAAPPQGPAAALPR